MKDTEIKKVLARYHGPGDGIVLKDMKVLYDAIKAAWKEREAVTQELVEMERQLKDCERKTWALGSEATDYRAESDNLRCRLLLAEKELADYRKILSKNGGIDPVIEE